MVIFGQEVSPGAYRLYNAVVSTGAEIRAQRMNLDAVGLVFADDLIDELEWLAKGPKLNWSKVVGSARSVIRQFIEEVSNG